MTGKINTQGTSQAKSEAELMDEILAAEKAAAELRSKLSKSGREKLTAKRRQLRADEAPCKVVSISDEIVSAERAKEFGGSVVEEGGYLAFIAVYTHDVESLKKSEKGARYTFRDLRGLVEWDSSVLEKKVITNVGGLYGMEKLTA